MKFMKNITVNFFVKCLSILLVSMTTSFAANYDIEVFEFQQKLADGGDAQAQFRLATMYESGRGVEKDNSLAMNWYKKSSSNNHPAAKRHLKYIDIKQSGFKAQDKKWLRSVYSDAKKGDESALLILGKIHENGTGVKKNLKKSRRYFKLAFNRGNTDAEAYINRVEGKIFSAEEKLRKKNKLIAFNKEQEIKKVENNNLKKENKAKKVAKNKPQKRSPAKQLSNNNIELKRLEAERNKIARERKELEALRKDIAETKAKAIKEKAIAVKTAEEKPVENKTIASNEATSYTTDMCNGKAARFMSRCQ